MQQLTQPAVGHRIFFDSIMPGPALIRLVRCSEYSIDKGKVDREIVIGRRLFRAVVPMMELWRHDNVAQRPELEA